MAVVKICGLTRLDDALAAAQAGADLLGFVLVASSPRSVRPEQAAELIARLRQNGVPLRCVGVVAGLAAGEVRDLRERCGFDLMQLHGDESAATIAALSPWAIVARRVTGPESLAGLAACPAYACLLDARGAERRGEAAATWDWRLLRRVPVHRRVLIAGGLRPENVAAALRQARPWGVDVSSGVEAAPGRKDQAAVAQLIRNVREVEDELDSDPGPCP